MTDLEIALASAVVHLIEYIDTGETLDLVSAEAVLSHPAVEQGSLELQAAELLPLRRDGLDPFNVVPD